MRTITVAEAGIAVAVIAAVSAASFSQKPSANNLPPQVVVSTVEPERAAVHYEPSLDSLAQHTTPNWFQQARYGVLINWRGAAAHADFAATANDNAQMFASLGARYLMMNAGTDLDPELYTTVADAARQHNLAFGMSAQAGINEEFQTLIDTTQPQILWNPVEQPLSDPFNLLASYYNLVPDGVVNGGFSPDHADFDTLSLSSVTEARERPWMATWQLDDTAAVNTLVDTLVDVVSKNGSLALDVSLMPDGRVPDAYRASLRGLGEWLDVNGPAIFGSAAWAYPGAASDEAANLRFTRSGDSLYIVALERPANDSLIIPGLSPAEGATISLLGHPEELIWFADGEALYIALPGGTTDNSAYTFRISPMPE